jgi:hypothetical protein
LPSEHGRSTFCRHGHTKDSPKAREEEARCSHRPHPVDAGLARGWNKALAALDQARREGTRAYDLKYETVGSIIEHDPPLYLAGGVSSVVEFVARYLPGESRRSVLRDVRVAQYASPDEEKAFGTSNIDAAIDYLEAKHGKPRRVRIPVDFAKLRIETEEGRVPFPKVSVDQIRAATRVLKRVDGPKKRKQSPVVTEIVKRLPRSAREVTVHFTDGLVSLGRIPARMFVEVMRALTKAAVPTA